MYKERRQVEQRTGEWPLEYGSEVPDFIATVFSKVLWEGMAALGLGCC